VVGAALLLLFLLLLLLLLLLCWGTYIGRSTVCFALVGSCNSTVVPKVIGLV
jgi:Gpi18-like mannosyltransferase